MGKTKLITATKLQDMFSSNRVGQGIFPELIKKLIIATANTIEYTRFPSGDAIYNPGFDGIVKEISAESRFVPNGNSYWELGTNRDAYRKLKSDFEKREPNIETTFVFCSPQILDLKKVKGIINKLPNHNLWKEVRIIDAVVLEDWLAENIEVVVWLLKEFGNTITDYKIKILEDEVNRIHTLTEPQMSNEFLVCSNKDNVEKIIKELKTTSSKIISIKPNLGREQGYFFTIGALQLTSDESITSRVIIVKDQDALNFIDSNCKNKIIVINSDIFDGESLTNKNIYIYYTLEDLQNASIILNQARFNDYEKCIEDMGIDKIEAGRVTSALNRNILCFKRKYAVSSLNKLPMWAKDENKLDIIPLALVSKFDSNFIGDCEVIAKLAGTSFSSYLEKLEKWLIIDDSPIGRIGSVYFVNSKEEVMSVLQLSMQSSKIKPLIELLDTILTTPNPKYGKNPKDWQFTKFNDKKLQYTSPLINGIISTLAILSNEDNIYVVIKNIIDKVKKDNVCLHSILEYFPILSEVSSKAVLDYIETAIDADDKIFRNVIEQQYGLLFPITDLQNIITTLHGCLQREKAATQALRIYLKLYYSNYSLPKSMDVENDLIAMLAPITSGYNVAATAEEKFNVFKSLTRGNNKEKGIKLIKKFKFFSGPFAVSSLPKWKIENIDNFKAEFSDIYQINNLANEWLRENCDDKLSLMEDLISNIIQYSETTNQKNFAYIKAEACNLSKKEQIKLHYFVINQIYKINVFADKENEYWLYKSKFLDNLNEVYSKTLPDELFDRYAYIFKYDLFNLPIANLIMDPNVQIKNEDQIKENFVDNCIEQLKQKYGERIVFRIIDESENGFLLGKFLKKYFANLYIDSIKYIIKQSKINIIADLFTIVSDDELITMFEQLTQTEKNEILKYLPLHEKEIDYINGTEFEPNYWKSRTSCCGVDKRIFDDKVFHKLLKYNPTLLIDWFTHYDNEINYEQQLMFLNVIPDYFKDLVGYQFDLLNRMINQLDDKFYTIELSQAELKFLRYYLETTNDFPLGIKKYYWNNPNLFVGMISESAKYLKQSDTIGSRIIYSIIIPFGRRCWIPINYISEKADEFKRWVDTVLVAKENYEEKISNYIDCAIINILAMQPHFNGEKVWPSEMVANMLESLGGIKLETQEKVASQFCCAKRNTQVGKWVGDGSAELKIHEEFINYKNYYKATHPTTSLALAYIADNFKCEANMNKTQNIIGWE